MVGISPSFTVSPSHRQTVSRAVARGAGPVETALPRGRRVRAEVLLFGLADPPEPAQTGRGDMAAPYDRPGPEGGASGLACNLHLELPEDT